MNDVPPDCWACIGHWLDALTRQCLALTCIRAYKGCHTQHFDIIACVPKKMARRLLL